MTQSPAAAPAPTGSHTRPAAAALIGVTVGLLTLLQGFFGSGHIPSGAEIAAVVSGSGVSLGSIGVYVLHHLGVTKAQIEHDAQLVQTEWAKAEPLLATVESTVPDLQDHLDRLEQSMEQRFRDLVAGLPAPLAGTVDELADKVRAKILADATKTAAAPAAPAAGGSS